MYRIAFILLWFFLSAQRPSVSRQFYQQHQLALHQLLGQTATPAEIQALLGYILDEQHTEVEPNSYFRSIKPPLAVWLAQQRGNQAEAARLATTVVYPLLRYVLPRATPIPPAPPTSLATRVAAAAYRYVGVRYGPPTFNPKTNQGTLDCSGLVNLALADAGVTYPRGSGSGATEGIVNSPRFYTVAGAPLPGDLLARQHGGAWRHIGIYVGNGYLIEAPYRGTVVRRVVYRPEKWLRILRIR
ncbi:C40 family peptidase [Fibrella sp. WM1]|uniref:C40 family peptidase n=1 Tax=Fibrella musci TaxID=3242485 RepID=UPI00351FEBF4